MKRMVTKLSLRNELIEIRDWHLKRCIQRSIEIRIDFPDDKNGEAFNAKVMKDSVIRQHGNYAAKIDELLVVLDDALSVICDDAVKSLADHNKRMNRCAEVEETLIDIANGKRDMLTREECRAMSQKLAGYKP